MFDLIRDAQASALMQAIASLSYHENLAIESFVFYNGRERWLGIDVFNTSRYTAPHLFIIFGESRNSDCLCVQHWHGPANINPPSIHDMPDSAYAERRRYGYMRIDLALEDIRKLVHRFAEDRVRTSETT